MKSKSFASCEASVFLAPACSLESKVSLTSAPQEVCVNLTRYTGAPVQLRCRKKYGDSRKTNHLSSISLGTSPFSSLCTSSVQKLTKYGIGIPFGEGNSLPRVSSGLHLMSYNDWIRNGGQVLAIKSPILEVVLTRVSSQLFEPDHPNSGA